MLTTHAVGIDLGTTYSCIAHLNEHGEPVTLPNQEGELATPSVVMFDESHAIVGTEALRNTIVHPERVIQNSKRFIGDSGKHWEIDERRFTPVDVASLILKKLISAAQDQIGNIEEAVITVPAQFSDAQRHATIQAGHQAGLQRVDIINEPVAAALCYVLGTEGLWFTELADAQNILVYDLGGGTFDLSLVSYQKNEVRVISSTGDLELGGIDWTQHLVDAISDKFEKEFGTDPRTDAQSLQSLSLEAEQTKRSLTVRPRASLVCQHDGQRQTYQVEQQQFERLTRKLVDRTTDVTKRLLKGNKMGWAHIDVVLTTGGSSRMPMIRNRLKQMSGTTLNSALSPDQSIAHGATYYAGMLLSNKKFAKSILNPKATQRLSQIKQHSVTARGLGVLIRDMKTRNKVPHYLIPANTSLPAAETHTFGTVVDNQKRVHLQIVESSTSEEKPPVKLGGCVIEDLPPDLPEGSEIAVTIQYDRQARVQVSARDVTSGKEASTEILRQENLVNQLETDKPDETELAYVRSERQSAASPRKTADRSQPAPKPAAGKRSPKSRRQDKQSTAPNQSVRETPKPRPIPMHNTVEHGLEQAAQPIPLCNSCGEPLNLRGDCPACGPVLRPEPARKKTAQSTQRASTSTGESKPKRRKASRQRRPKTALPPPPADDEILELGESGSANRSSQKRPNLKRSPRKIKSPPSPKPSSQQPVVKKKRTPPAKPPQPRRQDGNPHDSGEDEFWQLVD